MVVGSSPTVGVLGLTVFATSYALQFAGAAGRKCVPSARDGKALLLTLVLKLSLSLLLTPASLAEDAWFFEVLKLAIAQLAGI